MGEVEVDDGELNNDGLSMPKRKKKNQLLFGISVQLGLKMERENATFAVESLHALKAVQALW